MWQWIAQHGEPLTQRRWPSTTPAAACWRARWWPPSTCRRSIDAAMDGYAVRGEETIGASDYNPLAFRVIGRALPGQPFDGTVQAGRGCAHHDRRAAARRRRCGGPGGVRARHAARHRDVDGLRARQARRPRWRGHRARHAVLAAGRRLRPQDVGVLASLGIDRGRGDPPAPRAHRRHRQRSGRARVGRRVRTRSTTPTRRCCADWSRATAGCWRRICAPVTTRLCIRDAITAPGADVVLVSGGSSVGTEDHAPRLLAEVGELAIHGVAMRPSSPAGCGRIGDTLVFLLPGNPVSCLCAYDFFAGRAIRLRGGLPMQWPYPERRVRGCPQDRFGHRARRLLPCAPARRRGRTAGLERRIGAVVDHACRWLRRRARRQRRPCAGQRSHVYLYDPI